MNFPVCSLKLQVVFLCYNQGMFTGIIEEIGSVLELSKRSNGAGLKIRCNTILDDIKVGDSISINGCCQTVTSFGDNFFTADVSDETLRITTFADMKSGDRVNLERALTPSARMGGHIVQGHVDCKGRLINIEKLSDFYNMSFEVDNEYTKYIVQKGSIAVNGVSLTIADVTGSVFKAAVIPHTYLNTTLSVVKIGDYVNIETDILGRYIEKLLSTNNNNSRISESFLIENGFM